MVRLGALTVGNAYIEQGPDDEIKTFQEVLEDDPFWLLVACILVNRTNWKQAKPVLEWMQGGFFVEHLATLTPEHLQVFPEFRALGLWKQRSKSIINLAKAYHAKPPKTAEDVLKLPGCGKYAADSWAIFIEGRTDVEPTDKVLIHYLERNNERV